MDFPSLDGSRENGKQRAGSGGKRCPRPSRASRIGGMLPLEQSPAARSLDVFVIKTLVAESLRKERYGIAACELDLIAGKYGVAVDWFQGRALWSAVQMMDDGRIHLVACSAAEPIPQE